MISPTLMISWGFRNSPRRTKSTAGSRVQTFLPLATTGFKKAGFFLDDADALHALTNNNFDSTKIVIPSS